MHKCSEIQNLQTELKYLNSLNFDWLLTDFRVHPARRVGVGVWGWDSVRVFRGVPHTRVHVHMHACMQVHRRAYMYKHDNFMQMAAPIGKSWGIPLWHHCSCARASAHVCVCVCAWEHVCGVSPKQPDRVPPPSTHPYPRREWTPEISQKSIKI